MAETEPQLSVPTAPPTVGDRLRAARTQAGLDLADIASRTRIPLRHLEAIERGDYAALPAQTYATGFTRAYARALDLDEVDIIRDLRSELAGVVQAPEYQPYPMADPARVPPRWLAWGGVLAVVVVLALFGWWYTSRTSLPPATETAATDPAGSATGGTDPVTGGVPAPAPAASTPVATSGPVVLIARQPVWLRIYDATDTRLFEKEMAQGERYEVPATANQPMILTGKPDALDITVNGQSIPPLGDGSRTISGVVLTAQALAQRTQGGVPAVAPVEPPPANASAAP